MAATSDVPRTTTSPWNFLTTSVAKEAGKVTASAAAYLPPAVEGLLEDGAKSATSYLEASVPAVQKVRSAAATYLPSGPALVGDGIDLAKEVRAAGKSGPEALV